MRLNEHSLRDIISDTYTTENLKPKTLSDYASRLTSWLIFAKLLEKKGYHGFVIPKNINCQIQEFCIEPEIVQLEISLII